MKFKVAIHRKSSSGSCREESPIFDTYAEAVDYGSKHLASAEAVYILKESGKGGHPDHVGRFFLHLAMKG